MTVANAWHTFRVRQTLLTSSSIAFEFGPVNASMRLSELRNALASTLYIELLSVLDEAIEQMMTPEDYARGRNMYNRLAMLNKAGELLNYEALDKIRDRRNEMGHEFGKGATVDELAAAIENVEAQLNDWKLVAHSRKYELRWERSHLRASTKPGFAYEQDMTIKVITDGDASASATQTTWFQPVVK